MADPHVISALERKRSELSGDLLKLDKQRLTVKARIAHIDAAMREFGYNRDPSQIAPRVRHARLFKRNELKLLVMEYLRTNGDAPALEIACYVCERKGWDVSDRELVDRIARSAKASRRLLRKATDGHGNVVWGTM